MADRDLVCDYIIMRLASANEYLNLIKLQKLMYYAQAWHLAFYKKPLFIGRFQAWVHGPVNRELYDRFAPTKSLYSTVARDDAREQHSFDALTQSETAHIDSVLEVYAPFTGTQLEEMTHKEDPWVKAREGFAPADRCEREIDETLMQTYYAARVSSKA